MNKTTALEQLKKLEFKAAKAKAEIQAMRKQENLKQQIENARKNRRTNEGGKK